MSARKKSSKLSNSPNWIITPGKFLSLSEVERLIKTCIRVEVEAGVKGRQEPVRDSLIVDLALNTGLRVSELSHLKIENIYLEKDGSSLVVQSGKGGKRRLVRYREATRKKILSYLDYRMNDSPYLFPSQRGERMKRSAIQKVFKKMAIKAGLPSRYSIHSLRHTHATILYRLSGHNLRMVQKQLGHSSITTTTVYSDVMDEEVIEALGKLQIG